METIDDIVREIREFIKNPTLGIKTKREAQLAKYMKDVIADFTDRTEKAHEADKKKLVEAQQVAEDALCKLADKSEAVVKHDLTTATDINVGSNAAKMREALEHIREYATVALSHSTDSHVIDAVHNMDALAKSALSAPPRNCDVGTAEEQFKRFDKFCESRRGCYNCERYGEFKSISNCLVHWAQMPYEEGGLNENDTRKTARQNAPQPTDETRL